MSSQYTPFDAHASPDLLKQSALDFFSFNSPSDVLAPHPDLFESELDSSLAGFDQLQLQLLTVDQTDAFSFLRSDTPTCGPGSTITVSSESASAYESLSSQSESYYNYTPTNYSYPLDIDMDFSRVRLSALADYNAVSKAQNTASGLSLDAASEKSYGAGEQSPHSFEDSSFGTLPPASPARHSGSGYSDYGSDYFPAVPSHPSLGYSTVSPSNISHSASGTGLTAPFVPSHARADSDATSELPDDPRRKYPCAQCPRAFARAYNLKTHMATHDPNRPKPHVCPHRACSRSFSRKHDLGRHLVSIHRDEPTAGAKFGVAALKDGRRWCDDCGKSFAKEKQGCECADVK